MLEVYAMITDSGALDAEPQAMLDRLIEDHTRAAVRSGG